MRAASEQNRWDFRAVSEPSDLRGNLLCAIVNLRGGPMAQWPNGPIVVLLNQLAFGCEILVR